MSCSGQQCEKCSMPWHHNYSVFSPTFIRGKYKLCNVDLSISRLLVPGPHHRGTFKKMLTRWGTNRSSAILQTTHLNAFSLKRSVKFDKTWLILHWVMIPDSIHFTLLGYKLVCFESQTTVQSQTRLCMTQHRNHRDFVKISIMSSYTVCEMFQTSRVVAVKRCKKWLAKCSIWRMYVKFMYHKNQHAD